MIEHSRQIYMRIRECPKCGYMNCDDAAECAQCGIVFKKYDSNHTGRTCPYCAEQVRPEAVKCKHCGEILPTTVYANGGPEPAGGHGLRALYDFSFQRLVTPLLLKSFYAVVAVLGVGLAAYLCVSALRQHAPLLAAGYLLGYLAVLFLLRVFSEILIVVFRIEKNTRRPQALEKFQLK
jgi:hypothetical protein